MHNQFNLEQSKICPISGKSITEADSYICFYSSCACVDVYRWNTLNGCSYRCERDYFVARQWADRKNLSDDDIRASLELTRSTDYDEFLKYSDDVDQRLKNTLEYFDIENDDVSGKKNDVYLLYTAKRGYITDIQLVHGRNRLLNICNELSRTEQFLSFCPVKKELAEAVFVREYIKYGYDVRAILLLDNPIYIKQRDIGRYVGIIYGISWFRFKRILERNEPLTQIKNADNTILLKKEMDEMIIREITM